MNVDMSDGGISEGFPSVGKKFTDVRMEKMKAAETDRAGENARTYWDGLRVSLIRFFEGPPIGKYGVFQGVVLTVFKFLEGEVTLIKDGVSVSAGKGDWMVCHPGERFQDFSDSARIISIHLLVESPGNAAAWSGGPVLAFGVETATRAGLDGCVRRMRRSAVLRRLEASGKICPLGVPETFAEALELQEVVAAFFRRLMGVVEPLGMRYEAPPIRDVRVRESRQRLAAAGLREGFSRERLAAGCGLSASQLDRLWREELGQTPAQFWHARRLQAACALLQGDAHSIKEIAFETGFPHLSQFSFWFAKAMNESPRAFRSRHERD
ncbi:DNA-binding domain-containing protein, AraC-type [Opitutaceae bacterium TAV1]|nr:DNA-binding domain-containing protein, AraC-type [Opitutaceae bacterium TAV1]